MNEIPLWRLFLSFLKIGAFTFGGGYAMIPVFEREFVHRYKYLKEEDFNDVLVMCQSLPGVIAINFSVFIGLKLRGKLGALVSAIGVALPSFIIILVIATFFFRYVDHPTVEAVFRGVRVAVVVLIFTAGYKLFKANRTLQGIFLAVLTFALVFSAQVHPFIVIVLMGLTGYLITTLRGEDNHDTP